MKSLGSDRISLLAGLGATETGGDFQSADQLIPIREVSIQSGYPHKSLNYCDVTWLRDIKFVDLGSCPNGDRGALLKNHP